MTDLTDLLPILMGFIVGFLIGLTGMGGGAIMTPFLILFIKLNPILAVGTDLVFAATTRIVGGMQHWREKNVNFKQVGWLALGSLPSAFIAAQFNVGQAENQHFIEDTFPVILGVVLVLVGGIIASRSFGSMKASDKEPKNPGPFSIIMIGIVGGTLVGFTSIGGGTVIMALFLVFFAIPLNALVGLDVVHGALLATVSAISYIISGQVEWGLAGLLLIGSIPGSWLGARLVNRIDPRLIRITLILLIILAGVLLLLSEK